MFKNASDGTSAFSGGSVPPGDILRTGHPDLTIIVPTRNESGNVEPLLDRIAAAAGTRSIEVLFVDDSDDDTPEQVRVHAVGATVPVRLLHRGRGERRGGLGGAVVAGLREARGSWAVVMDGDLQHPPELAVQLAGVGRSRDLDIVVASRHVGDADADGLGTHTRHAVSGGATRIAKAVFPRRLARLSDPMSGLFAIRTAAIDLDRLEPQGFKILMEIMVRYPRLRLAEVPFHMQPRNAGESKACLAEGVRFARHLSRLRFPVLARQVARSARSPKQWALRAFLFGLVGLSGLLVNTAVFVLLLGSDIPLHYLVAAVVATEVSTTWLFLCTELVVFRGAKPGRRGGRMGRFFLLNHVVLLARLPLLALLVEMLGINVVVANVITLVLLFLVRFVIADAAIYGAERPPQPAPEPMRIVVEVPEPMPDAVGRRTRGIQAHRGCSPRNAQRYLQYRYSIPDVATIGSQVALPELEYFRAQYLGHDTDIQVRVAPTGDALPRTRAMMTQKAFPPSVGYSEHLGRLGANFHVELGEPILVTVAPPLAASPHVVYTNILEALLRFVAVSRGVMLLHSACVELDGVGMLISAETDTGKTGTVLRMVREHDARFLSDDMTILHPDGRAGCFPKPLTISHHTLRAIGNDELSPGEWRRLRLQSRLHSKEGRQFAMLLAKLNIPIMGVNALTQWVVPPPKYTVDRLLRCTIIPSTEVSELFLISRGPHDTGELSRADAMKNLLANTEDAYQFPPFKQLAPSIVIGEDDHLILRRKEHAILASALCNLRCRSISTPDFSWADRVPELLRESRFGAGTAIGMA